MFGFYVNDPERFGVIEFDKEYKVLSIEEKSAEQRFNYAVIILYFYPVGLSKMAKDVKLNARGEGELTTLNQMYLEKSYWIVALWEEELHRLIQGKWTA